MYPIATPVTRAPPNGDDRDPPLHAPYSFDRPCSVAVPFRPTATVGQGVSKPPRSH